MMHGPINLRYQCHLYLKSLFLSFNFNEMLQVWINGNRRTFVYTHTSSRHPNPQVTLSTHNNTALCQQAAGVVTTEKVISVQELISAEKRIGKKEISPCKFRICVSCAIECSIAAVIYDLW